MDAVDHKRINYLGEFIDKALEKEYFNQDMKRAMATLKPIVLILGILNTLFIVPDYFLVLNRERFILIALVRLLFIFLVIFMFLRLKSIKSYHSLAYWITSYEIYAVLIFLFVYYQYESPDFLIQAFGVMVIILAVFLVPNRWINMILVSFISASGFIGLTLFYFGDLAFSKLSAGIVYIFIVGVLCSIYSFRNHYYKRMNYLHNKELIRLSTTDPLSGAYNRARFDEELMKNEAYSRRYGTPLSLVIFDFDDFKHINDTYGHLAGDQVIVQSSAIIKANIRDTDIYARWGGEEFVILLPNTDLDDAIDLAERLRRQIESHAFGEVKRVTCSFGVVRLNLEDHVESLLNRADKMLYLAKSTGKNNVKS